MLHLFKEIANEIRQYEPRIRSIDIRKRQFEDEDEYNAIVHPAVLVALPDVAWQNVARRAQTGVGKLVVSVVVRLPAQTHDTDPLWASNLEELDIEECINNVCVRNLGLNRTATRSFSILSYFVVEHTYEVALQYASLSQPILPKPEADISPELTNQDSDQP